MGGGCKGIFNTFCIPFFQIQNIDLSPDLLQTLSPLPPEHHLVSDQEEAEPGSSSRFNIPHTWGEAFQGREETSRILLRKSVLHEDVRDSQVQLQHLQDLPGREEWGEGVRLRGERAELFLWCDELQYRVRGGEARGGVLVVHESMYGDSTKENCKYKYNMHIF